MSIIWRKVWRDLWRSKFRTFLVVLSTAVGVFALGFVFGLSGVMRARLTEDHRSSLPAHVTLGTGMFDEDLVKTILEEPGIADAEPETWASVRWRLEGEEEWHDGLLIARADYEAQRMNLAYLEDGAWPGHTDTEHALAAERMTSGHYHIPVGATIVVEFGRRERSLPVEGVVRYPQAFPPPLTNLATFFAAPETIAWLNDQPEGFDRLNIRLESFSEEAADEVGERIQERLNRMGVGAGGYSITDPEVHGAQETIDSVLLILTVLGGLSLGLSGFLIINMMNATVAQQVWQIGVMKVVGATGGRVVRIYLTMASIYGLLSLLLAVLPGAFAAHLLASVLLNIFNAPAGEFQVMPTAVAIQIAVGLVVPLVAALVPVIGGARITPHKAISNYGLGAGFGRGWLDRLVGRVRRLPRPLALSLRNTFRRKARIALTLLTLVLGGVMFMVVMSLSASMDNTLEVLLGEFGFDVLVIMDRYYRVARLVDMAESVPGVTEAEVWDRRAAQLALPSEHGDGGGDDGEEEREIYLWGVPSDSEMFKPRIISGRGLLAGDGRAILLNSKIAADEGFQVGDEIELTIGERESTWTVVGLILNVNNLQRDNFVPFDALTRATGNVDRGVIVTVMAEEHDSATQLRLLRELREVYTAKHMQVGGLQSADETRQMNKAVFDAVTYLMLAMVALAAIVGSVGLMSTMSINVVERAREIGVMRAIGARSATIIGIFVVEGMLVGMLSWLIAVPISYPGARVFNDLVGDTFQVPFDFDYSVAGVVLWLALVALLSAGASLWPALSATQVSVRESLAYE